MLMRKNVNNDINKDSPIVSRWGNTLLGKWFVWLHYWNHQAPSVVSKTKNWQPGRCQNRFELYSVQLSSLYYMTEKLLHCDCLKADKFRVITMLCNLMQVPSYILVIKKTVLWKYARWLVKNRVSITRWKHRTSMSCWRCDGASKENLHLLSK